jgi:subtilisin family serine protease
MTKSMFLLFVMVLLFCSMAYAEINVEFESNVVDAGEELEVNIEASDTFYYRIRVYDENEVDKGYVSASCAGYDKCESQKIIYGVPLDFEGRYSLRIFDYASNDWVDFYFIVIKPRGTEIEEEEGDEEVEGEVVPVTRPAVKKPWRARKSAFPSIFDTQVQILIQGSQKLSFEKVFFDEIGARTSEEILSFFGDERVTDVNILGDTVQIDIEQDEFSSFKLQILGNKANIIDLQSYIVEFKEEPVLSFKREQELKGRGFDADEYKGELEDEHKKAFKDLNERLNDQRLFSKIARFLRFKKTEDKLGKVKEFSKVFNGAEIKANPGNLKDLRKSRYVKKISPNLKVKASLYDSVPLINANDVWELDEDGNDCSVSGKDCLTGEGITIAIIDTGVDYTHPDLGGCFGDGCKVVGGYDIVNEDEDPMDDQGHGTHVAGTAAGEGDFIFAEPGECEKVLFYWGISSYDDGNIIQRIVELEIEFEDVKGTIPVLGGNWNETLGRGQFNSIGPMNYGTLVTSDTNDILIHSQANQPRGDDQFIVSWDEVGNTESYYFVAWIYNDGLDDFVVVNDQFRGGFICNDLPVGGVCNIGDNIELTVESADYSTGAIEFSINEGGSFDKVYDANGNYVHLPSVDELPAEEYEFVIKYSSDRDAEKHFFNWDSEGIVHNPTKIGCGEGTGLKGVAPGAKLYAYKVLNEEGSGTFSDVIEGIEMAVDPNGDGDFSDHVDIISMSLGAYCGGYSDSCGPDDSVSQAIDNAVDNGVIAVIAAGNDGPYPASIGSPGTARKALTVGATTKDDEIADFSSRGPVVWEGGSMIKPDVVAPGVDICAAQWEDAWEDRQCFDNEHTAISGTSMATPHVAGLTALARQAYPELSAEEIKGLIKVTSKDLGYHPDVQGVGRVDASAVMKSKISVLGDLNAGRLERGVVSSVKKLKIKNLLDGPVPLSFEGGAAYKINRVGKVSVIEGAISFNETSLTLGPNEEKEVEVIFDIPPDKDGFYMGRIFMNDGEINYSLEYSFSRFSELTLSVRGDHYPNFYMHNDDMTQFYGASSGWDFSSNSFTFFIEHGNYSVYAINDFISPENPMSYPETDEYILSDIVEVPVGDAVEKEFRLSDARKFTIKANSLSGNPLRLFEWHKGITTYKDKYDSCQDYNRNKSYCEDNTEGLYCYFEESRYGNYCRDRKLSTNFYDPIVGDREVYVSNKPDNGLDTDVIFKYMGVESE